MFVQILSGYFNFILTQVGSFVTRGSEITTKPLSIPGNERQREGQFPGGIGMAIA
ncbi:hypothetical protein [Oscillatoria sp. FACHB-1406]|uniref:hypothetical protein n=1 Tax=Oscillatoria sp. FACHB-1406 TaxID=2692846 RepID=UPI0016837B4D|nr:hypothetical protein [Oscillatoria sp. FACHB-1406]MBD2576247.1 hypothetical protein [Oscillatoria sp. FACHB-1406]